MGSAEDQHPRGFVPIGIFFLFGATMAAYAAVTLLKPGTALDALWTLNKAGHAQLASLGNATGDLINGAMGEWLKGAVGVAIAGLLLIYMTRSGVRNYFGTKMK